MVWLGSYHDSPGAKGILKIFSKTWKRRSRDSVQYLQTHIRHRRQGHIKCKHMKKVKHLPTCIPTALGFYDNNNYPSALPQQGSNRSHGKGLVDNQRDSGSHLTLLITHFPSPNASEVQVFSDCLYKWFLPILPAFFFG